MGRPRHRLHRVGLFQTAGRPRTLDIAIAGRGGRRRTEDRRMGQRHHWDHGRCSVNTLKPYSGRQWVIPPDANAAFVAAMEDVLRLINALRIGNVPGLLLTTSSCQTHC